MLADKPLTYDKPIEKPGIDQVYRDYFRLPEKENVNLRQIYDYQREKTKFMPREEFDEL